MPVSLPRLYAILDVDLLGARGLASADVLNLWMDSGVQLVQLRAKSLSFGPTLELAVVCGEICRSADRLFIVNDRLDVARLAGATGVHLGQDDLGVADARGILADWQIVGRSTHDLTQLRQAVADDADYIAVGPVFATTTKSQPDPVVGLSGVRDASVIARAAGRPLVAIGGITLDSAADVIAAGADSVAVISDLVRDDWRKRAADYVRALS